MLITRKSPVTGKNNTREIAISAQDLVNWYDGKIIMTALQSRNPKISDDDAEFLVSGMTPECWNELASIQQDAMACQGYQVIDHYSEKHGV